MRGNIGDLIRQQRVSSLNNNKTKQKALTNVLIKKKWLQYSLCAHSTLPSIHVSTAPARPRHDLPARVSHLNWSHTRTHSRADTCPHTQSCLRLVHYYLLQYSDLNGESNLVLSETWNLSSHMLTSLIHCHIFHYGWVSLTVLNLLSNVEMERLAYLIGLWHMTSSTFVCVVGDSLTVLLGVKATGPQNVNSLWRWTWNCLCLSIAI